MTVPNSHSNDGDVVRCRLCGCTDEAACPGGCWWVPDPELLGELCSTCLPLVEVALAASIDDVKEGAAGAGPGGELAELLEECADCVAVGRECEYHRGVGDGWDACAAFVAGHVEATRLAESDDRARRRGVRDVFDTRISLWGGTTSNVVVGEEA